MEVEIGVIVVPSFSRGGTIPPPSPIISAHSTEQQTKPIHSKLKPNFVIITVVKCQNYKVC